MPLQERRNPVRRIALIPVFRVPRSATLAAIALVAGCATIGANPSVEPAARSGPATGDGRIYFYRETFHALSVQPEVTVNGQIVGTAVPNAYFHVDRKPGSYEIATTTEPDRKFALTLGSGESRYVSLEFTVSWFLVAHINPVPVDSATGAKDIAGLHYTGR